MTQEDLNEVMGKSLANYQLRHSAEDGGNLESALTLIDKLESELLNAQEHIDNLEFLLKQKNEKISQLEAKAEELVRVLNAICVLFDNGERKITVGERANLMIAKAFIEKYSKEWTE